MSWSAVDEAQERRLYAAGKSAFWLYPDRWKGVAPGKCMNFEQEDHSMNALNMIAALAGRSQSRPVDSRKYVKPEFKTPVVASSDALADGGLRYARGVRNP